MNRPAKLRKIETCTPQPASAELGTLTPWPRRAELVEVLPDGQLLVRVETRLTWRCDFLVQAGLASVALAPGDEVVVLPPSGASPAVVLGRIGRYAAPQAQPHLTLEATESLTLKCGEASVELRADGRAMLKGEDVLLRAKGTHRIRAGNVAIN